MYFKKLEIFGFKSFADKTVLNFEPGITAIVGPNGCGKSNVFDAIRWVLGEQSIKELRGSAKEDVIFNGTDKRPSLGFAEVSLTFTNDSRSLPVEYDEVIVTRRLFRSGESEYLLNKKVVRLKDIQEMLMGTGIGAEAYSLVQQGKVDQVVSARPEDRRMILDEASGITKYKAKKREALNKLKATDDNLLRVNDITIEVKRQIGSIERQANKARKYKDVFEQLKNLEISFAKYQMKHFTDKKKEALLHIDKLKNEERAAEHQLEELNEQLNSEINALGDIERAINEVHSQKIKLESEIDLHNRQIGFNQERIQQIDINGEKISQQKEQLIEKCRIQQEKIEILKQELVQLTETQEQNADLLQENRDQLGGVERVIEESKNKIKDNEEKILILTSQQVNVRNELTDIMKEIQGGLARKRRLEVENDKVIIEKETVRQKLQNIAFQINSFKGTINDLCTDKDESSRILNDLTFSLSHLRERIDELEKKKLSLISQKEFIEKLHTQYQDIPDPVVEGRIIASSSPLEHHTGIIGKVKEVRQLDHQQMESLKSNFAPNDFSELYEIVCETKFIELDPQQVASQINGIAQDIEMLNIQKAEQIRRLEHQQEIIKQLDLQINEKEKRCSVLEAQRDDITEENKKLIGELELIDQDLADINVNLESVKKKEDELNYKIDTINQELGWHQKDIKDKQSAINVKLQEKEQITITVTQLETEIQSRKDKLISQQENLKIFTETLDSSLEEIKKIEDELSGQASKREQFIREIEELHTKIGESRNAKEALNVSVEKQNLAKEEMGNRINELRGQTHQYEDRIDEIKQNLHGQELSDQELSFNEQAIKDRLAQSYKLDVDEILSQDQAAVPAENGEGVDQPQKGILEGEEVNEQEMADVIAKLKKRCDAYGSVNLVAIEEYEELKERFEFLTKQQSDLLEAKSQLMSTIRKINRSTRQMFMDTFTKVSEEFRIYFRMLFGGGEAQLVLLDPENVLESGIEIIARPPGKKLQNINLLSGGEKTLTAIALIFGVFKVNPSPFCVLDEIDAALDESNVGRFSYLLQDFSKIAQFIVITHNKKTISSSNVMYGITMPETGISRIVSVKFSEDEKKNEMAEAVAV